MNLDEWLDLLPDNTTGEISAEDMRLIFTDVWGYLSHIVARIGVIENTGDEDELTVAGRWQINPVAGAVPQGGQMSADTNDLSEATWMRFATWDKNNVDMTNILVACTAIYAQQQMNAANWTFWESNAPGTVSGSYVQVPVTFVRGEGSLAAAAWQDAIVAFAVPASVADDWRESRA